MSKNYAVSHIGIGNRRFKPGEELPPISDAQWKRLREMGAIRSEYDPVEAEMALADEENLKGPPPTTDEENPKEPPQTEETDEETGKAEEADEETGKAEEPEEMPEIDVMDGIAEGETEKPKKRSRKAGKA